MSATKETEQDRMIAQHFMAARMKARVQARAVDHTPLVTAPDAVLDVLHDAWRIAAA